MLKSTRSGSKKGFTLVELLIALTISVLIILGFYSLFSGMEKINALSSQTVETQRLVVPIFKLMLKDVESASTRLGDVVLKTEGNSTLEFTSFNCYFTKGLCRIKYWTFKGFLVRTEINGADVPLCKVKNFKADYDRASGLVKIRITFENEKKVRFVFKVRS
jgi:prepilin-type N-terminal cleavage/methylation domain-containing protein